MSESTLTDDLIGWWSMNDCPTDLQSDELKRTKLIGENLTQITGLVGKAVEFASDGTSRLYAASNSLLQLAHRPFTFAVWVKFDSLAGNPVILSKTNSDPVSSQFRLEYDVFSGAIAFRVGNALFPNVVPAFNSILPTLGVWHFIMIWMDDADGLLHIRMDNSNYENVSANSMVGGMDVNVSDFAIGSNPDGTNPLDGAIDSVALWGRVLTRTEQILLWNRRQGTNFCGLLDIDCKTIDCCDPLIYAYQSSKSSDADGGMAPRLPAGLVPVTPTETPTTPTTYDPCAVIAPLSFLTVAETGKSIGWQSRWPGIAYCDLLDRVVADSNDDTGIAILNFNATPAALDYVLPLNTPFETRGLHYHVKAEVIIAWVRYGTAPGYFYRLAFLDPVSGFSSEIDLGVPGGMNQYEAYFAPITFKTMGVMIRSLTLGNPHLLAVVDVDARTVVTSAFFASDGGTRPTRDFYGLQYACNLGELITIGNKIDVDGVFFKYYVMRFNVSTLAITQEFFITQSPIDIRNPQYITSTGRLIGWSVEGYWDINPSNGVAVLFDSAFTGNVVPLYFWRADRLLTIDEANGLLLLINPHSFTKVTAPFAASAGDAWNFAVSRSTGRFWSKESLFSPYAIREFLLS